MGKQSPVIDIPPDYWYNLPSNEWGNLMVPDQQPDPIYYQGRKLPYNKNSESYTDNESWVLALSRYERDNLLHLLQAVEGADGSLHRYNSGDWVGMVGYKLADSNGKRDNLRANYTAHNEEVPPNADEWASMQRWLKFIRGQLLKTPRPIEDQEEKT